MSTPRCSRLPPLAGHSVAPLLGLLAVMAAFLPSVLWADARVPSLFGNHMVLQRDRPIPIWGSANPGERVVVSLDGNQREVTADEVGRWRVELPPLPAGGPHTLSIRTEANALDFSDVLVGDVWMCSGQSNMAWPVGKVNFGELEIASARHPDIRLLSVPPVGTQEPRSDFRAEWKVCDPGSVSDFSAVGYFFGRRIHEAVGVPIGLIDNAWGGSAAEAWLPRGVLERHPQYQELLGKWDADIAAYTDEKHARLVADHREAVKRWEAGGKKGPKPRGVNDIRTGQHRPGNIYNGMVHPLVGCPVRGMIWYQGENNAGRAEQYRHLFPLLISTFRELWGQDNLPFYWAQLADYRAEVTEPAESNWALLREAQTMALELPHTGQAVTIDTGEGRDVHPRDKQTVANRLALLALDDAYGFDLASRSPRFEALEIRGGSAVIRFRDVSERGLYAFDTEEVRGFAVAGDDRKFHRAVATITGPDTVEVSSKDVPAPVAVRYAWADNPVANLYDAAGLPVTPFRTDDWPAAAETQEF